MLKILKASAGSGKTYNLAREYISLIVKDDRPDAYRHVLAVTFTNKATDEMKRRILKELNTLSKDPKESKYRQYLTETLNISEDTLQKRATRQLSGILHDYSAFAVSTIDRFFQQTLRAFSREIGQFASYQVQLDREALVTESVDRVLDSITEQDHAILDWLTDSAKTALQQKGKFSIEDGLMSLAKSLNKLPDQEQHNIKDRQQLKELKATCVKIRRNYEKEVQTAAQNLLDAITGAGLKLEDFNGNFLKILPGYTQQGTVKPLTEAVVKKAGDQQLWFPKTRAQLLDQAQGIPMEDFLNLLIGQPYKLYSTAQIIEDQIYALGMAAELQEAFTQIQQEKNVISLDDSNTILKHIIDGTDTPFIYEKLGVRFDDFLLDEFQDTSYVQWENFRPLLHGSIDSGNTSLVVGDVKQSIYRWRGSDWNLLDHELEADFRSPQVTNLDFNWRTCKEIVAFNNEFFQFASQALPALVDPKIYADVEQTPRLEEDAPGSVEVVFTQDQMAEILATLEELRKRHAQWQDIAILVRNNADGAAVAAALVENNIPVVSDDSLYVKSSVTVRRLVSQLSLVETPPSPDKPSVAGYLAQSMGVTIPEGYHSLVDLAEALLRDLAKAKPDDFNSEVPYIQSFMDYLQDWVSLNGNNLGAFLKAWQEAKPQIASPQQGNSVRVMTIHKSKGLEFPFVIFPFAEKVTLYRASSAWCKASAPVEGAYYVDLTESASGTLFSKDYEAEKRLQAIDNLNVFYVAMTRPKYGLKVIAAEPPAKMDTLKNMSQVLYRFCGGTLYSRGEPYDFSAMKREVSETGIVNTGYASFPADSGERLKFSPEAADYFGPDGTVGPSASNRIRGNVMHAILSRVVLPEDLPAAVDAAVFAGELPAAQRSATIEGLSGRIASVSDHGWFSPTARVFSEAPVFGTDGLVYRPDRVVIHTDGSVDVVDYKFGAPEDKYKYQVLRYMNLYKRMGYAPVRGFLWYLEPNTVEQV